MKQTKTARRQDRYSHYVSDASVRRVWAAVTQAPCATTRALGNTVGLSAGGVSAALRILNDAGYIHAPRERRRARTVLVPFVEVRQEEVYMSVVSRYLQAAREAFPQPSAAMAAHIEGVPDDDDLDARQVRWDALSNAERETLWGIAEQLRQTDAAADR